MTVRKAHNFDTLFLTGAMTLMEKGKEIQAMAGRTTLAAVILLLMPLAVWFSGWQWLPEPSGWGLHALYAITETVTQPWGIITHLLLCAVVIGVLRPGRRNAIILFAVLSATVVLGQGLKSLVKERVQEPRPFVIWLEKTQQIPVEQFYTLKRKERSALVKEQLAQQNDIPGFLRHHWQKETGFAFPSGHTMFAATWALLIAGLMWSRRRMVIVVVAMAWAISVMGSRLLLGMHWPLDLMVATVMSWLLATLACWLVEYLCGPLKKAA